MRRRVWRALLSLPIAGFCFSNANAAKISVELQTHSPEIAGNLAGDYCAIKINGTIEPDDGEKFRIHTQQLMKHFKCGITHLQINSQGGSLAAALSIAEEVDRLALTVVVPSLPDRRSYVCASACFFIWAAGKRRLGDNVAVHRPHFTPNTFKSLSVAEARRKFDEAEAAARQMLEKHEIPADVIHQVFATDSRAIAYLPQALRERLRNKRFYEEMLIASCGEAEREAENRSSEAIARSKNNTAQEKAFMAIYAKADFIRCEFRTMLSIAREIYQSQNR